MPAIRCSSCTAPVHQIGKSNGSEPVPVGNPSNLPLSDTLAKIDPLTASTHEKNAGIEEINLKKLLESADSALNVPVRPGDIVKVPRAGIVYVVGEVQKPGGFVLQNNESISVLQALALAQGTTHTSAISRARIIRTDPATGKRTEIPMNLGKIFSGKAPDAFLQPKDIVVCPKQRGKKHALSGLGSRRYRPLRVSRFTSGERMAPDDNDQNKMEVFTAREVRAERRYAMQGGIRPAKMEKPPDLVAWWKVIRKRRWTVLTAFSVLFLDRTGRIHRREARVPGQSPDRD